MFDNGIGRCHIEQNLCVLGSTVYLYTFMCSGSCSLLELATLNIWRLYCSRWYDWHLSKVWRASAGNACERMSPDIEHLSSGVYNFGNGWGHSSRIGMTSMISEPKLYNEDMYIVHLRIMCNFKMHYIKLFRITINLLTGSNSLFYTRLTFE